MRRLLFLIVLLPFLSGAANLTWDEVTTDIVGDPETVVAYRLYARAFNSADPWVLMGETPTCCTFDLASSGVKREYLARAVDAAGNVGEDSNVATAFPSAPGQLKVNKGP